MKEKNDAFHSFVQQKKNRISFYQRLQLIDEDFDELTLNLTAMKVIRGEA